MKEYDKWHEVKKLTNTHNIKLGIKQREIFWAKIGQNVGFEQDGKGEHFSRPVIVIRQITKDLFVGIPTSTKLRDGNDYFHTFRYFDKDNNELEVSALILQLKVFTIKRLMNKIGMINKNDFNMIVNKSKKLIAPT